MGIGWSRYAVAKSRVCRPLRDTNDCSARNPRGRTDTWAKERISNSDCRQFIIIGHAMLACLSACYWWLERTTGELHCTEVCTVLLMEKSEPPSVWSNPLDDAPRAADWDRSRECPEVLFSSRESDENLNIVAVDVVGIRDSLLCTE
jgi:hypothetical protein